MAELLEELLQMPEAINQLIDYYQKKEGAYQLTLPAPTHPVLIGMGASYHAAWVGAYMLHQAGIPCTYMEGSDVLLYNAATLSRHSSILYISQSGSSGEIQPILTQLQGRAEVIGITNRADSPLAQHADHLLPIMAGDEQWIASKTYTNTLALLWLAARRWSAPGPGQGGGFEELRALADRMAEIQQHSAAAVERLSEVFQSSERVIFLGHGPHAATARQAAMTLSEWPKLTSLNFGLGAFRHGFIEIADSRSTVIIFAPPGSTHASAWELGKELDAYGVRVLFIENGRLRAFDAPPAPQPLEHEFLSPILDILPIQLFAEANARRKFSRPGFRYISKVVSKL